MKKFTVEKIISEVETLIKPFDNKIEFDSSCLVDDIESGLYEDEESILIELYINGSENQLNEIVEIKDQLESKTKLPFEYGFEIDFVEQNLELDIKNSFYVLRGVIDKTYITF